MTTMEQAMAPVASDPDGIMPRYAEGPLANAFGWWAHDCLVHPLTGTLGLAGRLAFSLRLMALAHHIHNVSAPSNDVIADYVEAARRAGQNESAGNPTGSMTPGEQYWAEQQAERLLRRKLTSEERTNIGQVAEDLELPTGWGGTVASLADAPKVEGSVPAQRAAHRLRVAEAALEAFLRRPVGRWNAYDVPQAEVDALRREHAALLAQVEEAREALAAERRGTTVADILASHPPDGRAGEGA